MEIFSESIPKLFNGETYSFNEKEVIKKLTKLYQSENSDFISNTATKKTNLIPVIIKDKDDDYFYITDMYGVAIDEILSFKKQDSLIEKHIEFPAKKDDYPEIYSEKEYVVKVVVKYNKDFKYFNYFKNDLSYKLFNKHLINRYETKLNISAKCKISPVSSKIKEIKDSSIVFDDDNNTEVNVDTKYVCVKIDEYVNAGDLLEKRYYVFYDLKTNNINIKSINNQKIKSFYLPIDNFNILNAKG